MADLGEKIGLAICELESAKPVQELIIMYGDDDDSLRSDINHLVSIFHKVRMENNPLPLDVKTIHDPEIGRGKALVAANVPGKGYSVDSLRLAGRVRLVEKDVMIAMPGMPRGNR